MSVWLTIIVAGIATYLTRASFLLLGDRVTLPATVQRALRYVAPAAFAGIAIPAALGSDGIGGSVPPDARILAVTLGILVAWRTRSVVACMAVGMVTLWFLQSVGL